MSISRDESHFANLTHRIHRIKESNQLLPFQPRTQLNPNRILNTSNKLNMRPIQIPRPFPHPDIMRTPIDPSVRCLARQFLLIVKEKGFVGGEYFGAIKNFADEGIVGADMSHEVEAVEDGGDCLGVLF